MLLSVLRVLLGFLCGIFVMNHVWAGVDRIEAHGGLIMVEHNHFKGVGVPSKIMGRPWGALGLSFFWSGSWIKGIDILFSVPRPVPDDSWVYNWGVTFPFIKKVGNNLGLGVGGGIMTSNVFNFGGRKTLQNGSGTATFYLPDGHSTGFAPTLTFGFYLTGSSRFSFRAVTYMLNPISIKRMQFISILHLGYRL